MKHLKINGNIVLDKDNIGEFKRDLKRLLNKYAISPLSRSAIITVTQNLSTKRDDYKAGRIFKLDLCKEKVCYFLFVSVGKKQAIVLVLNEAELDYIKKYVYEKDLFTGVLLDNSIQYLYFDSINYFIPKIRDEESNQTELAEVDWIDIDFNLIFVESLGKEATANIVAQFRNRNIKRKDDKNESE